MFQDGKRQGCRVRNRGCTSEGREGKDRQDFTGGEERPRLQSRMKGQGMGGEGWRGRARKGRTGRVGVQRGELRKEEDRAGQGCS